MKFWGRGAGCDSEIDAQSKNCNRFGGDGATRFIPSTVGGHQRASEVSRPTLKVDRQTRTGQQGNAKRDNRENANRTTGRTRAGQRGKRERDNREDTKGAKMKTRTGTIERGPESSAVWRPPILRGSWGHVVSRRWPGQILGDAASFAGSLPVWSPGAPHEVALSFAGSPRRGDRRQNGARASACCARFPARTFTATVKPLLRIQRAPAIQPRVAAQSFTHGPISRYQNWCHIAVPVSVPRVLAQWVANDSFPLRNIIESPVWGPWK